MPTPERCIPTDSKNKQAQALVDPTTGSPSTPEEIRVSHIEWLNALASMYEDVEAVYRNGLMRGIPKEVARVILPVGRYSRMRASTDLWNWLHFLTLRMSPNAQWEIRQYANVVGTLIAKAFPRTWELFSEKRS